MNDYTELYGETLAELLHPGSDCLTCGDTGLIRVSDPYGDYMESCPCGADEENDDA